MQSYQSIESLEQNATTIRRWLLIALAAFLASILICNVLRVLWRDAAPDAATGLVRGLLYWSFAIPGLVAAIGGIWLFALHLFKYAPQINRARFDLQTSMLGELQQKIKQLQEKINSATD